MPNQRPFQSRVDHSPIVVAELREQMHHDIVALDEKLSRRIAALEVKLSRDIAALGERVARLDRFMEGIRDDAIAGNAA